MKFIIVQGSSHRKLFVHCYYCHKSFVWLKAYEQLDVGVFMAVCSKCRVDKK